MPNLTPAREVPASLQQLWTAPSPKTTMPLVVAGAVVTGDGRDVEGRDPVTGATLWSYARDLDLCGVTWVYHYAVAVYPDSRGCGQVSAIDATTGRRGPIRTGYADPEVTLSSDGTTVLSAGDSRLEQWRSDLVRMIGYGSVDARIKPDVPASPVCRLVSAAASSVAVSVLEACPKQADLRLTLLRPADEEDTPDLKYVPQPGVTDDSGARVVAVAEPPPRSTCHAQADHQHRRRNRRDRRQHAAAHSAVTGRHRVAGRRSDHWWTGDSVVVFAANGLRYRYTVAPSGPHVPVGPAAMMAGRLIVPVTDGIDVFDPVTGAGERHIPLQRPPTRRWCRRGGLDGARAARRRTRGARGG